MNHVPRVCLAVLLSTLTCSAATAPARAQHAPPPADPYTPGPPAQTAIPPTLHPSLVEEVLRLRLTQLEDERLQLIRAGRPPYFRTRRTVGFMGLATGIGMLLGTYAAFYSVDLKHNGEPYTRAENVLLPLGFITGLGLLSVGIWGLCSAKGDDPYRERIDDLSDEQERLRKEIKRARRERRRLERYSMSGGASLQPHAFTLRVQLRL